MEPPQNPPPSDVAAAQVSRTQQIDDGQVATYIPELGKANPNHFGICMITTDGHVFRAGDWDKEFTIQSMCKPFAFQMALEECGMEETLKHMGMEPSGDAFNSIELDPKTTRPSNPIINAGAIAIASLMPNFNVIDEQLSESLHQYFARCSMLVTCQDMAMMAATLANMAPTSAPANRCSISNSSNMF